MWEAILDSSVGDLGEIVWIVDLNRQSLDRVVPNIAAGRLEKMFAAAGWQVITVTFGRAARDAVRAPGRRGAAHQDSADAQSGVPAAAALRRRRAARPAARGRAEAAAVTGLITELDDDTLIRAVRNLGGHDLDALRAAYAQIDDTRPTVIIAYTIKGYGLPTQGHPQNHSSLLTIEQFDELAANLGMDATQPWCGFDPDTPAGRLCTAAAARLHRDENAYTAPIGADRYRTHAVRHVDDAGRARPCPARPDPRGTRSGQAQSSPSAPTSARRPIWLDG